MADEDGNNRGIICKKRRMGLGRKDKMMSYEGGSLEGGYLRYTARMSFNCNNKLIILINKRTDQVIHTKT